MGGCSSNGFGEEESRVAKVMLFIDGTWVYATVRNLARVYGEEEFLIDYGKLPQVLAKRVGEHLGSTEIDIVRSYLFGSFAVNYAPRMMKWSVVDWISSID
jgi:hypothetical protein